MPTSQTYFSQALRTTRETARMTQQEMAEKLCVCRSCYTYYETGRTQPDLEKLTIICRILGVSSDSLLGLG